MTSPCCFWPCLSYCTVLCPWTIIAHYFGVVITLLMFGVKRFRLVWSVWIIDWWLGVEGIDKYCFGVWDFRNFRYAFGLRPGGRILHDMCLKIIFEILCLLAPDGWTKFAVRLRIFMGNFYRSYTKDW